MGKVDLNFMPNVPVFDANAALGRRHDKRVNVDTVEGTIAEMDRTGVTKALVYAPHGAAYDSTEGNQILLETIGNNDRLIPQFCAIPTFDKIDDFSKSVNSANVISWSPNLRRRRSIALSSFFNAVFFDIFIYYR